MDFLLPFIGSNWTDVGAYLGEGVGRRVRRNCVVGIAHGRPTRNTEGLERIRWGWPTLAGAWASLVACRGKKPWGQRRHFRRHLTPFLAAPAQIEIYN